VKRKKGTKKQANNKQQEKEKKIEMRNANPSEKSSVMSCHSLITEVVWAEKLYENSNLPFPR
jgi:hypothetical protein